jgi:hypothetical protein
MIRTGPYRRGRRWDPVGKHCQKILRKPLETKSRFSSFVVATELVARPGAIGLGTETGTGGVRCFISILLSGGFGYAHL